MFLARLLIGRAIGRLVMLALVLVVAGGAAWWFFVREDNQLATAAPEIPEQIRSAASSTPAAGSAAPATSSGAQVFTIVPEQSEAAYFAGETLARLGVPSTAKGATRDIKGQFALTADGLDTANTTAFTVGLKSLTSDQPRRDTQAQNALQTSKFATATFTATKVTGFPEEFPADADVSMQLTGTLDLHGVQKEITWDVKARKEGNALSALATTTFKYADFNITRPNIGGFVSVDEDVTLQVQVIAVAS